MLLYHYCNIQTMMNIIENKYLRLSNALKTNDGLEYKYFGMVLKSYANTLITDSDRLKLISEQVVDLATEIKDKKYIPYVCCLSSANDLLSQWRGYGDDGQGVAIGFDFENSEQYIKEIDMNYISNEPFITKVDYLDMEYVDDARIVYHNMFSYLASRNEKYIESYELGIWQAALCAIKLKHFSFQEEQEYRIVWLKDKEKDSSMKSEFCPKKGKIINCYKFELAISSVVKEIVLGPKCGLAKEDKEFKLFLKQNNLENIKVRRSVIPYC